jgi:hypothetical protein
VDTTTEPTKRRPSLPSIRDMKISTKLLTGFTVVALVGALSGVIGLVGLGQVRDANQEIHDKGLVPLQLLGQAETGLQASRTDVLMFVLSVGHPEAQATPSCRPSPGCRSPTCCRSARACPTPARKATG